MNEKLRKNLTFVPLDKATTPTTGMFQVYVDWWWCVTPEEQLMFYHEDAPQCNRQEKLARRLHDRLYPGYEVRQIPVVYVPINPRDYV